ncbi:hypothetical protein RCL1_008500 [Eukaryota sp. TZLM3-RCL]
MPSYIASIDSGTTSNRCIIFDVGTLSITAVHQIEHAQIYPQSGYAEHNPEEIIANIKTCIRQACLTLIHKDPCFTPSDIKSIGVTNQRETLVVWDKISGKPLANAIVWLDVRTKSLVDELSALHGSVNCIREQTGLPLSTYFSGTKLRWLVDNNPVIKEKLLNRSALWGTIDSWILYSLTNERVHVTDASNASRTQLFNIKTLEWDKDLFEALGVPYCGFPTVCSSYSSSFGTMKEGLLAGVPFCSILGDQQSALLGQGCINASDIKVTYGTGAFLLMNTKNVPVYNSAGLVATIAWKFGDEVCYALEGSIAVAGSALQFCRDNLGLFKHVSEVEPLARSVDSSGIVFVPAFSGLFTPHWDSSARGTIVGMTQYTSKAHILRAVLDAVALQVVDVVNAMYQDTSGTGSSGQDFPRVSELCVDGGMVANSLFCQIQADLLDCRVCVSRVASPDNEFRSEATALGAALAAGVGIGLWESIESAVAHASEHLNVLHYESKIDAEKRMKMKKLWQKGLEKSKGWV